MQTMYSLLAMPAWFTENAKWFAIGAAVLIVILALVAGFSMGWGKASKGTVKNHYPKGLRRLG